MILKAHRALGCLALSLALSTALAHAQEETPQPDLAPTLELPSLEPEAAATAAAGEGAIVGTVFNNTDASPELGVEATLFDASGAELGRKTTDAEGKYRFDAVPAGTYSIRFEKPGFRTARMTEFPVVADQDNPGDFALSPETTGADSGVEEIVITAERRIPVADRANVDEFINTMDTAEIGKFAASDISEAIKRIPGINVVEGQFAIIRGLEDRYSSTLFNSAPVPSPDPDTQSVQLDLFPSDVASNLVVAKTFAPDLPSNSSGGSINIISQEYPEADLEFKLSGGSGYNTAAADRFVEYVEDSPIAKVSGRSITEGDVSAALAGRTTLAEREVRAKLSATYEVDFASANGVREPREPRRASGFPPVTGDLSLGELNLSGGRFDITESARVEQTTAFLDVGMDLDPDGEHSINFSAFYTKRDEEAAQLRGNGFLPNFDYSLAAAERAAGSFNPNQLFTDFATKSAWIALGAREADFDPASRGPLFFSSFGESRNFLRERDLQLYQLNGEHDLETLPGLSVKWVANHAKTSQADDYYAARFFFEPDDPAQPTPTTFPVASSSLGPGQFAANADVFYNVNRVEETQNFARLDLAYERDLSEWLVASLEMGFWYEHSERDVESVYLESPTVSGASQFALFGDTPVGLGRAIDAGLDQSGGSFSGLRPAANAADREIWDWSLGTKLTLWEDLDVLAGVRRDDIAIRSTNEPFTGATAFDGSPAIYPSKYLMFDRLDNPARGETFAPPPPGTTFNDQILGNEVPVDPVTGFVDLVDRAAIEAEVNGEIDTVEWLPSAGLTYRPLDGMNARFAYSQTVARPSFRELGYYVSVESGTDDLVVGNPQLGISRVESWDVRVEYLWGDLGDLAALSAFKKTIEDPIESIILRDPTDFEAATLFRTFLNNPDDASLWGVELEARKAIDFVGVELLEYLSIATNFTWIDAEVDRNEIELQRSAGFFGVNDPDDVEEFSGLSKSRRLFSQPEWIVNADLSFDHPEWGTKITLALFAISDVLDAVGSASLNANNEVVAFTLDRYVDSYAQLDLIASQALSFEKVPGEFVFKLAAKNLTDSTRRLIYDPAQTRREIAERSFKIGVDLSFSLSYNHEF